MHHHCHSERERRIWVVMRENAWKSNGSPAVHPDSHHGASATSPSAQNDRWRPARCSALPLAFRPLAALRWPCPSAGYCAASRSSSRPLAVLQQLFPPGGLGVWLVSFDWKSFSYPFGYLNSFLSNAINAAAGFRAVFASSAKPSTIAKVSSVNLPSAQRRVSQLATLRKHVLSERVLGPMMFIRA